MRRLLLFLILIIFPILLVANLVQNQPIQQTQPDGTVLSLFVSGDEYYHRVHDANGYTIMLHPETGYAVYAIPDGNTIKASNYVVGQVDPSSLGIQPNLVQHSAEAETRFQNQLQLSTSGHRASPTGVANNVVVFVRFHDQTEFPATPGYWTYDSMFNGTGQKSMADYYNEVSQGQLDVNSYLYSNTTGYVTSIQLSHNRNYYSPYNAATNPGGYSGHDEFNSRGWGMFGELCTLTDPLVPDYIDLDTDNDNINDALTFVFRGPTDGWSDILWPQHLWWTGSNGTINGVPVWHYVTDFEGGLGTSVICHEMGHMIGFPDLYHYTDNGVEPIASWSLMAWDNNQHETTYEKWKYGTWFPNIPVITPTSTPTQYTLTAVDQNPYSCYKIYSNQTNQFYMLEYRRQSGRYEVGVPGNGLIAYRVLDTYNGNDVGGNAGGPPDELYIYRPGGDIDTGGDINNAAMSSNSGRTALHNYTDPAPWLFINPTTQAMGSLVITDVGASGGTTITFSVRDVSPNLWTGSVSTDWATPANWSQNSIPGSSQYVEIPSVGVTRWPIVNTIANCKNLIVRAGASCTINSGSLTVYGDVTTFGTLGITNAIADLNINGSLYWESGSSANTTANGEIYLTGNMEFKTGSNVSMNNSYIDFNGTGDSYIRNYADAQIYHLRSNKTAPATLGISNLSTNDLTIAGSIFNYSGRTMYNYHPGTIHLKGNFNNYAGGLFYAPNGTISFEGTTSTQITNNSVNGCYFNNLRIAITSGQTLSLNTAIDVNGYLNLVTGILQTNSYEIKVGGNWTNSVGTAGFVEGTGQVILDGTSDQTISSEHFSTLVLNKATGAMVIPVTAQITADHYDWTQGAYRVNGGLFLVSDMIDSGIFGDITLNSGSIEYNQEAGSYVDMRATLAIHGGNFTIKGGSGPCDMPYQQTASLTMDAGVLDFVNVGIRIRTEWVLTENVTGGTIRTAFGLENQRADFTPTGGTIELYGTADCSLVTVAGSYFYNLTINKGARDSDSALSKESFIINKNGSRESITRTNGVTCPSALDINGTFTLSGGIFTAPATMQVAGNWSNTIGAAYFVEGVGSVEFNGTTHQYCNNSETFYTLLINKTAAFRVNNYNAVITCANYTWTAGAVDILSGTFTANDLTQAGIYGNFYANPGATINLHQDAGAYPDLNGQLYNYGGVINLYGGSLDCYWAYAAAAGITMTAGVIDFKDKGIIINASAYALTLNVTGGTIRTVGSFASARNAVNINAGVLELYGSGNMFVTLGASSNLGSLYINKSVTREQEATLNRQLTQVPSHNGPVSLDQRFEGVTATSNLTLMGYLNVYRGLFDVNGKTIQTTDDVIVYSTLKMQSAGNIISGDDVTWNSGSTGQINAGTISCRGNWSFNTGSTAQLTGCTVTMTPDYDAVLTTGSVNSWFGNLILNGNGGGEGSAINLDYLTADSLVVKGLLTIYGENNLYLNEHPTRVDGSVTVYEAGSITVGDGSYILMKSALDLHGKLDIGPGTAIVKGIYTSYDTSALLINWGVFTNSVAWARTDSRDADDNSRSIVELKGAIHVDGGELEITNNTVVMRANADRYFANCTIRVGVGFTANELNAFHQDSGELELIGNNNPTLDVSNGNYVCSLIINKGSGYMAYLQNDLSTKADIAIQSGGLIANNHNIIVGGDWVNNVGLSGFTPGTGLVTFNKTGSTQLVQGQTNFYNINETHTGTALEFRNTVSVSNILNVMNGVTFTAAANIATLNNTVATADLRFTGNYTSTVNSYSSGGIIRALALADVIINDITNNGIFGTYYADNGVIELHQDAGQWIDLNGPVNISNNGRIDIYGGSLPSDITYAGNVTLTMSSGELNFKNKGFNLPVSSYTFTCNITGGIIRSAGNVNISRTNFTPAGGRVELFTTADAIIALPVGSYFYDLYINKAAGRSEANPVDHETYKDGSTRDITRSNTASLTTAIVVKHNLQITSGVLTNTTYPITIYGNWSNLVGTTGFTEGTSTVTFAGASDDTGITSAESFYNLTINNTSANWNNFEIATGKTVEVTHDLIVTDGTINMQTGSALTVSNDITLANGAGINCQNGAGLNVTVGRNWTDNNAAYSNSAGFYPGTATLNFASANVQTITHTSPNLEVYNLVINKNPGSEVHFSKPVKVWGSCSITSGTWVDMVTALIHEFRGNLTIGTNGVWYASNHNTIAFKGSADQVFTNNGTSSIYSLTVDKPGSRDERANTVSFGSNILGLNGGTVLVNAGTLDLNNFYYRTTGNVTINNTGKISIDGDGSLELGSAQILTVNTGATLELLGTTGHPAKLTHQAGYYACNIESGATISAEYATFEYMNTTGIYVKSGALVDATHSFNNCTFQYGATSGTLLTINNSQTMTCSGVTFPANTWSGSYNVTKTLNQGTVNLTGFTGSFSGATYESDAYGRVNWPTGLPDLRIVSYAADYSSRYVCEPVNFSITVINDSDYPITGSTPIRIDLYYNQLSTPGVGVAGDRTYSLAGLGAHAQTTYTFPASSSTVAGTWQTYYRIDPLNAIVEANESNNAAGYLRTTWNALPVIAPTISYISAAHQVRLNWTYPTSVYQYKIYRSTNPLGPFTGLAGTSTTTTYSEAIAGNKYFYKIVAEKNWP